MTDRFYNLTVSSSPTINFSINDPFGSVVPASIAASSGTISLTYQTAGVNNRTFTAQVSGGPNATSTAFTVNPNNPVQYHVLLPGETAVPGSTAGGALGKTGLPDADGNNSVGGVSPFDAGTIVTATVRVTDLYWN